MMKVLAPRSAAPSAMTEPSPSGSRQSAMTERIALGREARPGFGRGRRHIDLISGIRQRQGQQLADIFVVLNQQDALFRHRISPGNGGLTTVSAGKFRWG